MQLSGDKNIQPARLAALMSIALRRLNTTNKNTAILCINQTRTKVGIVFGSPETTPGGKAMSYFASYRIRFTKAGRIRKTRKTYDGEKMVVAHDTVGQKIKCELVKSKLSVPEKEVWFVWDLEKGEVDEDSYLAAVAYEHGMYPSIRAAKAVLTNPKIRFTIYGRLLEMASASFDYPKGTGLPAQKPVKKVPVKKLEPRRKDVAPKVSGDELLSGPEIQQLKRNYGKSVKRYNILLKTFRDWHQHVKANPNTCACGRNPCSQLKAIDEAEAV